MQGSGDSSFTAQSNIDFFITSSSNDPANPIFTVAGNVVKVRGDLVITGAINTSNIVNTTVVQESLKVQDKVVTLATVGSNFDLADGPTDGIVSNSGAGIAIDGIPASAVNLGSNIQAAYEKSFKWQYGVSGTEGLMTSAGLSNESYWELKGGHLRLTGNKVIGGSNITTVSYSLRINELEEMEMVKTWYDSNVSQYVSKRVARFGRIV
jgi:hypothetical protein